jgi:hypothetical protein
LLAATALPTVVALSELGLRTARLRPETAAALVGAALLSVFLYPLGALALRRAGWTAVGSAAARGGRESDSATARPPGATAGRRVAPPLARRSRIVERTNGLPPALGGGSALT